MVGATRGFIAKPLTLRAIINGLFASVIAIVAVSGFILIAENFVPWLKLLRDGNNSLIIAGGILIFGSIDFIDKHLSVCIKIPANETG
ncbi:MAG: hypothetical protein WDM71_03080 [Ferruginibacter sp.]